MGPGSRLDAPPVLKDIFRSVEVKVASRDDFSSAGQLNRKGCVIALLLGSNIKHDLGNNFHLIEVFMHDNTIIFESHCKI